MKQLDSIGWCGICLPCGNAYGKKPDRPHIMGTYLGHCNWCGADDVDVVEPRDFCYPELPNKE